MKTIKEPYVRIWVKRPSGETEIVEDHKHPTWREREFQLAKEQTREAGRGEVLRYENIKGVYEKEEKDYFHPCSGCGGKVDDRKPHYSQMERGTLGKMKAFYCPTCAKVMNAVGFGELSDLDARAAAEPDLTPYTKDDGE